MNSFNTTRTSGVLLHPTSLDSIGGIGDLGPSAYAFADFLHETKQTYWQVLPLGPTGYGDSPYQCFSAFAGNPLLISFETMVKDGLLGSKALASIPKLPADEVDFGAVLNYKMPMLHACYQDFALKSSSPHKASFESFCRKNAWWLNDYALFRAVKEAHGGASWHLWEPDLVKRDPKALNQWKRKLATDVATHKFIQWVFFSQWERLRDYCHSLHVQIIGDMPIYVAFDSSDVWANPENYVLNTDRTPKVVAGVPPDYFSATGQLWGNPIYQWKAMAKSGYKWWLDRFRAALNMVDVVRLDHFRGFEAYWEVPAGEKTAVNGRWVKGPGAGLFQALKKGLGKLPIVAENLGLITEEVENLRLQFDLPGMAVLQFAFSGASSDSVFLPHNYVRDQVTYTGTHDNNTTVGWWNETTKESTRTQEDIDREKSFACRYLDMDGSEIHWTFIRAVLASVSRTALVPMQDILGLGIEARMNMPGSMGSNWRWRMAPGAITAEMTDRLREMTIVYDRIPPAPAASAPKASKSKPSTTKKKTTSAKRASAKK